MKKIMEKSNLELRMYFLVPYNISPIQQAIQAGHAAVEYVREYGAYSTFKNFADNHKTWIILNGGTTNNGFELGTGKAKGTLNQCVEDIKEFNEQNPDLWIRYTTFQEPDLNDALTAICLIVDERVFNREDYPDFKEWFLYTKGHPKEHLDYQIVVDDEYKKYQAVMGKDIVFLKELLNNKKLA